MAIAAAAEKRAVTTHRGHGHLVAKGGDFDLGMLGTNGKVGAGVPKSRKFERGLQ